MTGPASVFATMARKHSIRPCHEPEPLVVSIDAIGAAERLLADVTEYRETHNPDLLPIIARWQSRLSNAIQQEAAVQAEKGVSNV